MHTGDKTTVLSRHEERVLSAVPREYATDAVKIRIAAGVPDAEIAQILERLLVRRLIEASDGLRGGRVYRVTGAGLKHPQYIPSAARAQAPRLPVESDRVRKVLSAIFDSGELRIKDVTTTVSVPHQSINALMQYLKGKTRRPRSAPLQPAEIAEFLHALALHLGAVDIALAVDADEVEVVELAKLVADAAV